MKDNFKVVKTIHCQKKLRMLFILCFCVTLRCLIPSVSDLPGKCEEGPFSTLVPERQEQHEREPASMLLSIPPQAHNSEIFGLALFAVCEID